MKIFYTQVEEWPLSEDAIEEKEEIQNYIEKFVSPGTEIKYVVTPQNWSSDPQFPSGVAVHLSAPILLKAAIQAEKDGFDAVILGGTWDYGLEVARAAVDIPVIGAGQVALLVASMLADRIGVVSFKDEYTPEFYRRWRTHSNSHNIVSFRSIDMFYTEFHTNKKELEKRFLEVAEKAIKEDGAEIIFANCVTFFPNLPSREGIQEKLGVPVIDSLALSVKFAEMLASLKYSQSRKTYPRIVDFHME